MLCACKQGLFTSMLLKYNLKQKRIDNTTNCYNNNLQIDTFHKNEVFIKIYTIQYVNKNIARAYFLNKIIILWALCVAYQWTPILVKVSPTIRDKLVKYNEKKMERRQKCDKCFLIKAAHYTFKLFLKSSEKYLIIKDNIMP